MNSATQRNSKDTTNAREKGRHVMLLFHLSTIKVDMHCRFSLFPSCRLPASCLLCGRLPHRAPLVLPARPRADKTTMLLSRHQHTHVARCRHQKGNRRHHGPWDTRDQGGDTNGNTQYIRQTTALRPYRPLAVGRRRGMQLQCNVVWNCSSLTLACAIHHHHHLEWTLLGFWLSKGKPQYFTRPPK